MLVIESFLVIASYVTVSSRKSGTDVIQFYSNTGGVAAPDGSPVQAHVLFNDQMEQVVAKNLASVRQVSHVFTQMVGTTVLVWIFVDDPASEVRRRVYDRELDLISEFPQTEFDFNLIPRMGRATEDLLQGEAHLAYCRA